MFCKRLNFFGHSARYWRPCKIFAKLSGSHLLKANIFEFHKYQTFGLLKMDNMNKTWFANNEFSLWKSFFTINRLSKMLFFYFAFFILKISNDSSQKSWKNHHFFLENLMHRKTIPFYNGFRRFLWSSTVS